MLIPLSGWTAFMTEKVTMKRKSQLLTQNSGQTQLNLPSFLLKFMLKLPFFFRKYVGHGTVLLLCFLIVCNLAVNIYLLQFYRHHKSAKHIVRKNNIGLYCTIFFLSHPTHYHWDSWMYLYKACHYIHKHPHRNIYKELYFHRGMKFQYSPMSILLIEPFKDLSLKKFILLANYISWIAIWISIFILAKSYSLNLQSFTPSKAPLFGGFMAKLALAYCFTVTFYPLMDSYRLGQIQTWIYLFFILSIWMWSQDKKEMAGIFIGINSLIKPQFGLFFFWGLVKKQKRFLLGWCGLFFPALLLSLYLFGVNHHLGYIRFLHFISKHGESYYPNQSVNGLLYRLFHLGSNICPSNHRYAPYNPWIHVASYITFFLFVIPALFTKRVGHGKRDVIDFSIAALSFTIASPIAWTHHYAILLPLFAIAFPLILGIPKNSLYMIWLMLSFFLTSNFIFLTNYLYNSWLNILQSLSLFGAISFLLLFYKLKATYSTQINDK